MAQLRPSKNPNQIPLGISDKRWFFRLWEVIPGLTSWSVLIIPVVLSLVYPIAVAYFIIAFDLLWLLKSMRMSVGLIQGYQALKRAEKIDWPARLNQLMDIDSSLRKAESSLAKLSRSGLFGLIRISSSRSKYQKALSEVSRLSRVSEQKSTLIMPSEIYHVIITAVYNESLDVLRPSLEAILKSDYDRNICARL